MSDPLTPKPPTPAAVVVPTGSVYSSPIFWGAIATVLLTTLVQLQPYMTGAVLKYASIAIVVLGAVVTIYQKFYGTPIVTATQAANMAAPTGHQVTEALNDASLKAAKGTK